MKPKRKLKKLRVFEGSLVDRGANPHAHIVFYKRDEQMSTFAKIKEFFSKRTTAQILSEREYFEQISEIMSAFQMSVSEIFMESDADALSTLLQKSVAEFADAIGKLKSSDEEAQSEVEKSISDLVAASEALDQDRMVKAMSDLEVITKGNKVEKNTEITFDGVMAGLDDSAKAVINAEIERRSAKVDPTELAKSLLPEAVRKHFEALEADAKAKQEEIEKMKIQKAHEECVAKAKDLSVGTDHEKLAEVFMKLDAEALSTIVEALSAAKARAQANDVINKSLGSPMSETEEPRQRADRLAKELVEKSGGKMNQADAFIKVLEQNKDLYEALR